MSSLTATANQPRGWVRLDADFSDVSAPYVYVARVDEATGEATAVRTHGTTGSAGGLSYQGIQAGFKGILYDTEIPRDRAVHYTASAVAWQRNVNSDFADTVEPWTAVNNSTLSAGAGPAYIRTPNGYTALTLVGNGVTANPQALGEYMLVTVGTVLDISAHVITLTAGATAELGVRWYTSALAFISASNVTGATLNVYGNLALSAAVTAPATAAFGRLYVQITGTPAATAAFYWYGVTAASRASSATSAAVTVSSLGAFWLRDPLRPGRDVRIDLCFDPQPGCIPTQGIFFASMDTEQFPDNSGHNNVSNQPETVTVSRARGARNSSLNLVTRTLADRDRLELLVSAGTPLLFQAPPEYGIPDAYLSIAAESVGRVSPDHRFPIRVFQLPFAVEKAPGGPAEGPAGTRWLDQCNVYANWGAVKAAGLTWQQVTDGNAGGDP